MLGDPRKRKRMAEGGPHSRTGPTRESPLSLFLGLLPCPNTGFHGDGMGGGLESFLTCSSRSQRRILECLQPSLPSSTLGDEEPKSCPYQPISPCHPSPQVYLGQSSLLGHLHGLLHFPLSFPSTDLLLHRPGRAHSHISLPSTVQPALSFPPPELCWFCANSPPKVPQGPRLTHRRGGSQTGVICCPTTFILAR